MNTDAIESAIDERFEYILLTTFVTLTVSFVFIGKTQLVQDNPAEFVFFFITCWVLIHTLRYIFILLEKRIWYEGT